MLRAPAACGPGLALVGDRVIADRPGIRFRGGPPRPAVDRGCAGKAPDGQVTALVSTTSAEQTRVRGRAECEQQTQEVREGLADVRSLAVVPTCARFEPARAGAPPARRWGRTDRCTGRSGTVAGRPVSCRGNHDRQMLVFTRLGSDTALAQTRSLSDAAGARDVPPSEYGHRPSRCASASWTGKGAWMSGTHPVVCTVRRQNGAPWEATNHEEGVAMPGSTKAMGVLTVGGLVVVTAYTVALGGSGWLWFGWIVLGLITLGMVATRNS
ncbi:serine/threonine protein kinase [Streptomyces sp. NPDC004589]|uniref:serine/threonine protein kinase n=2 Tax=Streptomyces TaxID=1883 RepID=UPI0033B8FE6C